MTDFTNIATLAGQVAHQVNKGRDYDGLPLVDFTGNLWLDRNSEAVWVEVEDPETRTTHWCSLDFPEYAAHGETAVVAVDQDDRNNFEANRKHSQVTYRVVASDVDGLEPDEDLYTGLTRDEALATADSCRDMADPATATNFLVKPDPRP